MSQAVILSDHDLDLVAGDVLADLQEAGCPVPERLVRDCLGLLCHRRVGTGGEQAGPESYTACLKRLQRSSRWRLLSLRLGQLQRSSQPAGKRQNGLAAGLQLLLKQGLRIVVNRLLSLAEKPDAGQEDLLAMIGEAGEKLHGNIEMLVDAYLLATLELATHLENIDFLDQWLNRDLIRACLRASPNDQTYTPQELLTVMQLGMEEEKLPGKLSSVRGVTVKTQEDQLRDILPSEMALYMAGGKARRVALDQIVNGKPLIYEHFDTKRPEVKHRALLLFVVGAERRCNLPACRRADIKARLLAFRLLITASLRVPHSRIAVDVAWFELREGRWTGRSFELATLRAVAGSGNHWRNLGVIHRRLPEFFVHWPLTSGGKQTRDSSLLCESPAQFLSRSLPRRMYECCAVAATLREDERHHSLPPGSLKLPAHPLGGRNVLLCSCDDGEVDYRATTFDDLAQAHAAILPLPPKEAAQVIDLFMSILLGPVAEARRLPFVEG